MAKQLNMNLTFTAQTGQAKAQIQELQGLLNKINSVGGLRLQSFSDFKAEHMIDMMQLINEASSLGLKAQCYTKVIDCARLLAGTGVKMNLSIIDGYDSKTNSYYHHPTEGIQYKKIMDLMDKNNPNYDEQFTKAGGMRH